MAQVMKVRFTRTRDWLGLVGVALGVVAFLSEGLTARLFLYAGALALLGAIYVWAEEDMEATHGHLLSRPRTMLGATSVWLAAAGLVVLGVGAAFFGVLGAAPLTGWSLAVAVTGLVVLVGAGAVAMASWFAEHERSWLVLLAVAGGMGALVLMLSRSFF